MTKYLSKYGVTAVTRKQQLKQTIHMAVFSEEC